MERGRAVSRLQFAFTCLLLSCIFFGNRGCNQIAFMLYFFFKSRAVFLFHLSPITFHLSPITYHLSPGHNGLENIHRNLRCATLRRQEIGLCREPPSTHCLPCARNLYRQRLPTILSNVRCRGRLTWCVKPFKRKQRNCLAMWSIRIQKFSTRITST